MNAFEQLTRSVTARGAKAKKANNAPIRLEITESAYNDNPKQLVDTVRQLRECLECATDDPFALGILRSPKTGT